MAKERDLQEYIAYRLKDLDWDVVEWGKGVKGERQSLEEIILKDRFLGAIERINDVCLTDDEKQDLLSRVLLLPNTIEGIKSFMDFVKGGIPLKIRRGNEEQDKQLFLFDFENPESENNDFFAVKEFEVEENEKRRRFDLCLFVNGIPIVGIELKNPFSAEERDLNMRKLFQAFSSTFSYALFQMDTKLNTILIATPKIILILWKKAKVYGKGTIHSKLMR
jgi:type I site-specific restriction-modification system R (restriction) subunit